MLKYNLIKYFLKCITYFFFILKTSLLFLTVSIQLENARTVPPANRFILKPISPKLEITDCLSIKDSLLKYGVIT